jgi:hypothetical protein
MKVKDIELAAIRAAYAKLANVDQTVNLTAIVAGKRHHTRFYPLTESEEEGRDSNCRPGTLVDDAVTSPLFSDFYLQSHSGIQGTVKPTHYFILEDGMNMGTVGIQQFVSQTFTPSQHPLTSRRRTKSATRTCAPPSASRTPHPPTTPTASQNAAAYTSATSSPATQSSNQTSTCTKRLWSRRPINCAQPCFRG